MSRRIGGQEERSGRMEVGIEKINVRLDALPTIWTLIASLVTAAPAAAALTAGIAALFLQATP